MEKVPLKCIQMRSPTSPNAWKKLDIFLRRRVCALFDAVAGDAIHKLELHVGGCCRQRHGITSIRSEWKIEHEDLLELAGMSVWNDGVSMWSGACDEKASTYSQRGIHYIRHRAIFYKLPRILWYHDFMPAKV